MFTIKPDFGFDFIFRKFVILCQIVVNFIYVLYYNIVFNVSDSSESQAYFPHDAIELEGHSNTHIATLYAATIGISVMTAIIKIIAIV